MIRKLHRLINLRLRMRRRKLRITQNNFCLLFWQKLFIIHFVAPPFKICRTVVRQFLYYGVRVPTTRNNKKAIRYEYLMAFLVRWKGLAPPTYWFVASHSIQLSYQRVYVLHFLCFNTITQIK